MGRILGTVIVGSTCVNALLVRSGAAWVYRRYSDDPALKRAERMARVEHRGLWATSNPVPSWKWR